MFSKFAALFTTTFLGLTVSISALAIPPEIVYKDSQDDVTYPVYNCHDFWIMGNSGARVWITHFYNRDGDLIRETIHQSLPNTVFFNSENPEIMWDVGNSSAGFAESRFENGTLIEWRLRGMNWRFQVRGEKIVFTAGFQHCTLEDGCSMNGLSFFPTDEESEAEMCAYFAE